MFSGNTLFLGDKYDSITIYDMERYLRIEAIPYLNHVLSNYGEMQCIENLKHAAYFATDRNKDTFNEKQSSGIRLWVNSHCSKSALALFRKYTREGHILTQKKAEIDGKIRRILNDIKENKQDVFSILNRLNFSIYYNSHIKDISEFKKAQLVVYNENCVLGLGLLIDLGLLSEYESTSKAAVSDKTIDELIHLSVMHYMINDIIASWMFGEADVEKESPEKVVINEKPGVITDRIVSFTEYHVLNEAKYEKVRKRHSRSTDPAVLREEALRENIKEFLYSQSFTERYYDIPLNEWIDVYTFFFKLTYEKKEILFYEKEELVSLMKREGIQDKTIETAITVFSAVDKYDLFTRFLICYGKKYIILPSIVQVAEFFKSMMNLFSKDNEKSGIKDKGIAFEEYIKDLISVDANKNNVIHKIEDENSQNELDLLMLLNNTLFIIECKTQFQHENIREYNRNLMDLDYYLKKFDNNTWYFTQTKHGKKLLVDRIREIKPSFNLYDVKIVKVFVSNITYPFVSKGDTYIVDATKIFNYFQNQPQLAQYKDYIFEMMPQPLFSGIISDRSFELFLKNSRHYIVDYEKGIVDFKAEDLEKYGIYITRLVFDSKEYSEYFGKYINDLYGN